VPVLTYVSVDPGGSTKSKTCGVVEWDELGNAGTIYQFTKPELEDYLASLQKCTTLKTIICENYRVRPGKKHHNWSPVFTIQTIGAVKLAARFMGVEVVMQEPVIMNIASSWSGVKLPSNHSKSHWVAAYLHGYYYLHNLNVIKARVLERLNSYDGSDPPDMPA
jgi:hypothetical protein